MNAQNSKFIEFIDSFKEESSGKIIDFAKVVQLNRPMDKEDAINFVYNGDTSKLYCVQKIINIETEEIEGFSRELYLPSKCLRIEFDNCFLIAYSSYFCQNPNDLLKVALNISIIDDNYAIKENMIVYIGSDYESEITGLLNPKNGKMFLIGDIQNKGYNQAIIYKLSGSTKTFEKIKEEDNINGATDNLIQLLESLDWKESFMN
jgi:hypothetical protein